MVHINHLLVLAQPDFVGRGACAALGGRTSRGAEALRRWLGRR